MQHPNRARGPAAMTLSLLLALALAAPAGYGAWLVSGLDAERLFALVAAGLAACFFLLTAAFRISGRGWVLVLAALLDVLLALGAARVGSSLLPLLSEGPYLLAAEGLVAAAPYLALVAVGLAALASPWAGFAAGLVAALASAGLLALDYWTDGVAAAGLQAALTERLAFGIPALLAAFLCLIAPRGKRKGSAKPAGAELRRLFGRYAYEDLPPLGTAAEAAPAARDAALLVADLRGYAAFLARTQAGPALAVLDRFLELASRAVTSRGGYLERFEGDAVVAVFFAAAEGSGGESAALVARRACLDAALELRAALNEPGALPEAAGWTPGVGIGLEEGSVFAGALGPEGGREYRVASPLVDRAARFAQLGGQISRDILMPARLVEGLEGYALEGPYAARLNGLEGELSLFALLGKEGAAAPRPEPAAAQERGTRERLGDEAHSAAPRVAAPAAASAPASAGAAAAAAGGLLAVAAAKAAAAKPAAPAPSEAPPAGRGMPEPPTMPEDLADLIEVVPSEGAAYGAPSGGSAAAPDEVEAVEELEELEEIEEAEAVDEAPAAAPAVKAEAEAEAAEEVEELEELPEA